MRSIVMDQVLGLSRQFLSYVRIDIVKETLNCGEEKKLPFSNAVRV